MSLTIAFDLDGTLIDSVPHIHHGVASALAEMSLPGIDRHTTQGFVGRGLPILLERVLDHVGVSQDHHAELTRRTMHHYVNTPSDPDSVYPGAREALTALQEAGHRLTLCTNKPHEATLSALRDTGLAPFFEVVIGGDSLPTRKPDPAMLHAALDGASRALYVGDSETDVETAQNAGVPFLLFTEGYRKTPVGDLPHRASFADHADLPALVADLA
ncbi:phosphoglycolate phosphatase [Mameliella alba]|uniref:phosphoglycolate phosphatase n=1 Tax=Mameliella alba TaxID=561184 RepID=A0A0B3SEY2_9RHOB|nr:phosphoglycolate phosphatase [Mameliella alba]KHQ55261.1 Phosphoglycolate phosphatase [Mameliella alba]